MIAISTVAMTLTAVFDDDDSLERMRRVGTWINKKAEWTPEASTITAEETIEWVLDKPFIRGCRGA